MRRVDIITERASYLPGETIRGNVVLTCDKSFNTNGVSITLLCNEVTRVVHGSGKHRHVHTDQKEWINETYVILPAGTVDYGETRLDFSFTLPVGCVGVYSGMHGSIRYELRAKVELSRALDMKATLPLTVMWAVPPISSAAVSVPLTKGESEILVIEIPNDVIEISGRLSARMMMRTDMKMRGIRLEVVYREFVWPDGNNTSHETVFAQVFIPKEVVQYESWQDVTFELPPDLPVPFRSELIETSYHLKTTIDIPMMFDKSLLIPLKLGQVGDVQRQTDEFFDTEDFMSKRR